MAALTDKQFIMAGAGVVIVGGVLFWLGRKAVTAAVDTAGGVLSGNNALTQGTAYEGKGVVGTLGAAANAVSGGALQSAGEHVGGWLFDLFNEPYDPNAPTTQGTL